MAAFLSFCNIVEGISVKGEDSFKENLRYQRRVLTSPSDQPQNFFSFYHSFFLALSQVALYNLIA